MGVRFVSPESGVRSTPKDAPGFSRGNGVVIGPARVAAGRSVGRYADSNIRRLFPPAEAGG
jgi:hypothetical protein